MTDYFLSDIHLYPQWKQHPGRKPFHSFLALLLQKDPGRLWILGDLFDYWFEYHTVIPAGFTETLCSLRALRYSGWELNFIPGNHDWWCGEKLQAATGMRILKTSTHRETIHGKKCILAHGDGLGTGDTGYRLMKPVIRSRLCVKLFSILHPTLAELLAGTFSNTSRRILRTQVDSIPDYLTRWVQEQKKNGFQVVITGHTHCPSLTTTNGITHASLGDWISHFTYLTICEEEIKLNEYRY